MLRRALQIAAVGVLGLLFLAVVTGGWVVFGGPVQGNAQAPVTVDAETAAAHGFEEPSVDTVAFQERLGVAGVEKEVDVSAYVASTNGAETRAGVITMSLPGWTVAGISLNPVTYAPLKQTVNYVLPYLPMETPGVSWEGESTVDLGGENVTAGEYAVEGQPTRLVVARRTMGGDTVFAVGLYEDGNAAARDSVDALFAELSHG